MATPTQFLDPLARYRAFVRAFSGDAKTAELQVAQTLSRLGIPGDDTLLNEAQRFRLFQDGLSFMTVAPVYSDGGPLAEMDMEARLALLLLVVGEFDETSIQLLLDISNEHLHDLFQRAADQLHPGIAHGVLLVEDEPLIANMLADVTESAGFSVIGPASTAAGAMELVVDQKPSVIVADIILASQADGVDVVNLVRARSSAAAIFVTGIPEKLTKRRRPANSYVLTKPFSVPAYIAVLKYALTFPPKPIDWDFSKGSLTAEAANASGIADIDFRDLPAPASFEVIEGQLRLRRAEGIDSSVGPAIDRLRGVHHQTASRLCNAMQGTNLGLPFLIRMEAIRASLAREIDANSGIELGVQAEGLLNMLPSIRETLSDINAVDVERFVNDVADLAWTFPTYRSFLAEARSTDRLSSTERAALAEASRYLEDQPDAVVAGEVKANLAADRINAEDGQLPVAELAWRRSLGNVWRSYGAFLQQRATAIKNKTVESFDETAGKAIGTAFAVTLVILPLLGIAAAVAPKEFGAVIAFLKALKEIM